MSIRRTASAALAGTAVFAALFGASPAFAGGTHEETYPETPALNRCVQGEGLVGSSWNHLHQQQDQVFHSFDSVNEPFADHFAVR